MSCLVSTNDWYFKGSRYSPIWFHTLMGEDFLQWLLKNKNRKLTQTFYSSFRYIDVLSLNNSRFGDYLHRIYPNELELKDTTDT
jgi:hypothetical protein